MRASGRAGSASRRLHLGRPERGAPRPSRGQHRAGEPGVETWKEESWRDNGGASFDPETGALYVTSLGSLPFLVRLEPAGAPDLWFARPSIVNGPPGHFNLFRPPFASITVYDLGRGEILWQVPNHGSLGVVGHASSLVTRTLLFFETRSEAKLAALDQTSGELVWEIALPAIIPLSVTTKGRFTGIDLDRVSAA